MKALMSGPEPRPEEPGEPVVPHEEPAEREPEQEPPEEAAIMAVLT